MKMDVEVAPLLRVEALTLQAGSRVLVNGLTLEVRAGEIWAVLGPNGSGKTTLLHTLAGLRPPRQGQVVLGRRALADWRPIEAARQRGLLPQSLTDAFSASVLDIVLLGRHPHVARWGWEADGDASIARIALAAMDLEGFEDHDVLTLSGGERQRVGLAALLAQDPLLLLLDEPLAHLDLHHQIAVLEHLQGLARERGKAIVMSLHDLNLAHRFASHALVLSAAGFFAGRVDEVMDEETLGATFGHPLQLARIGRRTVFLPS